MSTAIVKAASTAVSNRIIQKTASQAVKSAAPAIAKAAMTAALTKVVSPTRNNNKISSTKTGRRQTTFAPVAYSTSFTNSGKVVRVTQSEVIQNLVPDRKHWIGATPAEYTILGLRLSPSNATTFPWLSNVAGLFDKFRFRKLRFTYVTTKPTNTPGNVAMAVDFDAYDKPPSNFVDMSNLAKFTTTPVYVNKTFDVPLNHPGNRSWYYNYDGNNGDLKTYNLGTFYLCLSGVDTSSSVGYLVVDYDVELCDKNPKLITATSEVVDDVIVDSINTDEEDVDPPDPVPEKERYFWTCINGQQTEKDNFFSFTDDGKLTFRYLKSGQTILGTVNWHDSEDGMTCTPGTAPTSINERVAVGQYQLTGNTSDITLSFALVVAFDVDEAVMQIPATGLYNVPLQGTIVSLNSSDVNP